MLASSPEADTLTNLTSHYTLLEHTISCQLGPIAGKIIRALRDHPLLTLKEVADAVLPRDESHHNQVLIALDARGVRSGLYVANDSVLDAAHAPREGRGGGGPSASPLKKADRGNGMALLTDAATKELMTRLVLHRVVGHDAESHTYTLHLGTGVLLHVLYPLIAQTARRRCGEAGEVLVLLVRQLALVPWDAAIRLAQERCPTLSRDALLRAANQLEVDGWIEFTNLAGGLEGDNPPRKRDRVEDDGTAHPTVPSEPARLCIEVILLDLLHNAILQWVGEHYVDQGVASAIVSVFLRGSKHAFMQQKLSSESKAGGAPMHGYPRLPLAALSPSLSPLNLRDAVGQGGQEKGGFALSAILTTVEALSEATSNVPYPLLLRSGEAGGAPRETIVYRLHYAAVVGTLQREVCERVAFARHGVLGIRLLKLLLRDRLLEDRTLAEYAIATQPRTRETLHAMLRDGYVYLQEAPRSGALTEQRVVKNSIFLWGCALERSVRPNVREQLAKTLHHALVKLREVTAGACEDDNGAAKALVGGDGLTTSSTPGGHPGMGVASPVWPTSEAGVGGVERKVGGDAVRRVVQTQRSILGLESCAASLMRLLLLVDYY